MENFNKEQLINKISEMNDISKKAASESLDMVIEAIEEGLIEHKKVTIFGFGSFEIKDVPARDGITQLGENKGQSWHKDASKAVKFKASKALKDSVNE